MEIKDKDDLIEFPLMVTDHASQGKTSIHRHRFYELVIIKNGHGVHVVDGVRYPVARGDVFLINDERAHGYEEGRGLQLYNVLYQPSRLTFPYYDLRRLAGYHVLFSLEPQFRQRHTFESRLRLNDGQLAQVSSIVQELHEELSSKTEGYQIMAVSLFMKLVTQLSRAYPQVEHPESQALLRIGEAISYLESHVDKAVTVEQLARISGMSRRNFQRAFHATIGTSPIQYHLNLRTARAKEYLKDTNLSVADIAEVCGYGQASYFVRQFKNATGMTPQQYRQNG